MEKDPGPKHGEHVVDGSDDWADAADGTRVLASSDEGAGALAASAEAARHSQWS